MANAAAKKAAAAKQQATSFYGPVLLCINILHFILTYRRGLSTYRSIITVLQWLITYLSYRGLLETLSSSSISSSNSKNLKGGAWIDILALVIFTQFSALFIGRVMDSVLIVVPCGYMLFQKFGGRDGSENSGEKNKKLTKEEQIAKEQLEERRRKRAEKRRQKRA